MAETVHLYLKANGSDIKGESTQQSLGRKDSIECLYYEQKVVTAREAGSGMATGRRQYEPLLIRKRIDKSSPLLMKALVENQKVDAVFKFFRPSPTGDGTTQQFYTVTIKDGRVATMKQFNPDTIVPATSTEPPMEEVSFVFHTINMTITDGGISHEDTWSANR
jgi:type VI secretion system secreted protein Hcp